MSGREPWRDAREWTVIGFATPLRVFVLLAGDEDEGDEDEGDEMVMAAARAVAALWDAEERTSAYLVAIDGDAAKLREVSGALLYFDEDTARAALRVHQTSRSQPKLEVTR